MSPKFNKFNYLRLLGVLLRPADEAVLVGVPLADVAVQLRVGAEGALVVDVRVAAADRPDAPRIDRLATVLYPGHGSRSAN